MAHPGGENDHHQNRKEMIGSGSAKPKPLSETETLRVPKNNNRVKASKMPKRRRDTASHTTGRETVVVERLIKMKVHCNFSNKQLQEIIKLYEPEDAQFIKKTVQKELRQNFRAFRLHGCCTCEEFIWIVGETIDCEICGNQAGR